jgi:hypothetical protein
LSIVFGLKGAGDGALDAQNLGGCCPDVLGGHLLNAAGKAKDMLHGLAGAQCHSYDVGQLKLVVECIDGVRDNPVASQIQLVLAYPFGGDGGDHGIDPGLERVEIAAGIGGSLDDEGSALHDRPWRSGGKARQQRATSFDA